MSAAGDSVVHMPPQSPVDDAAQRAVIELPPDADGVVIGAPGTGKTYALIERTARLLADAEVAPDEILVLTPSRSTATTLRDLLGVATGAATPGALARSLGSVAFQIVHAACVRAGAPAPQLLTGADQDRIIAELLRGDADDEGAGHVRWPDTSPPEARASRAFRSELRSLIAECTERGISTDRLEALGREHDRAAWIAAASFIREYRRVLARIRPDHRDAADLVAEATALLRGAAAGRAGVDDVGQAGVLTTIMIDDAQELTAGSVEFVRALRERGAHVVAFGDPDIGSGAFRGVTPELFADVARLLGGVHVLTADQRSSPAVARLVRTATQAIGAGGRVDHRRDPGPEIDDDRVRAIITAGPHEEVDQIARVLRDWHVMEDVAWHRMAVIAHDTRQIVSLEQELAARDVPTRAAGVQRPLGQDPAVRSLLEIVRLGITSPEHWDIEHVTAALRSPFGGLDAIGLRRVRAALRRHEFAAGGVTSAAELLLTAMANPLELSLLDVPEARAAERLATTVHWLGRSAERGETIHEMLWLVWDRAREDGRRLADVWRDRATSTAPGAAETSRALDALVAVFEAAKRAVERGTDADPASFIASILDTDVPEDTLVSADRHGVVALLTPASALGREFDAVVVAGVQDGVWPNVRLRGGLLDTGVLADLDDAGRSGREPAPLAVVDRRRAVLHDELRLFVRAVSRARTRLVVTAVDDDDATPSALFSLLPAPSKPESQTDAGHPLTLRGLVARHRRALTAHDATAARRDHAAAQLRLLAENDVAGAAPDEWYGVAPVTSVGGLRAADAQAVTVSPSSIESFEECGVDWAVRALGGDTRTSAKGLGTILHAAMEKHPDGGVVELEGLIDEHWPELELESEWIAARERRWATTLVGRLHAYLTGFTAENALRIGAEYPFELAIALHDDARAADVCVRRGDGFDPPLREDTRYAVLRGSIDRVELYPGGAGERVPQDPTDATAERVIVVDLKTGKNERRYRDDQVDDDAQLQSYQLAVRAGAVDGADPAASAGARLLVLSKDSAKSRWAVAHQDPLSDERADAFVRRVVDDALAMSSSSFDAHPDTHCRVEKFAVCTIHTIKAVSSS